MQPGKIARPHIRNDKPAVARAGFTIDRDDSNCPLEELRDPQEGLALRPERSVCRPISAQSLADLLPRRKASFSVVHAKGPRLRWLWRKSCWRVGLFCNTRCRPRSGVRVLWAASKAVGGAAGCRVWLPDGPVGQLSQPSGVGRFDPWHGRCHIDQLALLEELTAIAQLSSS